MMPIPTPLPRPNRTLRFQHRRCHAPAQPPSDLAGPRTHESPATVRWPGFRSGGGGSRTRVREGIRQDFYVRRALLSSPTGPARTPPTRG